MRVSKNGAVGLTGLLVSVFLVGCGSSTGVDDPAPNLTTNPGGAGEALSRAGVSTDFVLNSNVDGEAIAFTIHEPDTLVDGETYPLILESHGYGGNRVDASERPTGGLLGRFLQNGYGLLSLDERGHADSGGTIRILDPDFAGQDWLQVLDFAEATLEWLEFDENNNPIMGAVGGSYGGGYQHLIYAIDPRQRLDAIAPDITWHDLRYSLFPGQAFKTTWASLLSAGGNANGNRQDPEVNEGLAQGLGSNSLDDDKLALLYRNSLRSHCEGNNDSTIAGGLQPIDAFYTQSPLDTLFNFNDAYHNFQCVNALGGDVRMFTKSQGHGPQNGDGGENCGVISRDEATFQWYQEKLKGVAGAADFIPRVCVNLSTTGDDGLSLNDMAVGGTDVTINQQTITVSSANVNAVVVDLFTVPAGGEVLAGIPTIDLTISDPILGVDGNPGLDPILFVSLGIHRVDANNPVPDNNPIMNQVRPFRGYGNFQNQETLDNELNGVFERLNEGDVVVLVLNPSFPAQFASSASQAPATIFVDATIGLPLIGNNHNVPALPNE